MAIWNKNEQDYLNQERSLFEVYMRANKYGEIYEVPIHLETINIFIPLTPILQMYL
jgi:hypothetical protein